MGTFICKVKNVIFFTKSFIYINIVKKFICTFTKRTSALWVPMLSSLYSLLLMRRENEEENCYVKAFCSSCCFHCSSELIKWVWKKFPHKKLFFNSELLFLMKLVVLLREEEGREKYFNAFFMRIWFHMWLHALWNCNHTHVRSCTYSSKT